MRMQKTVRIMAGLLGGALVFVLSVLPDVHAGVKKSDSKVKVTAKATKLDAAGKQVVTVTFVIDKGWHIYANPVGNRDLEETKTEVIVKGAGNPTVQVKYPPGTTVQDNAVGNYRVYENKVNVQATVQRAKGDTSPLEVSVRFNACNDKSCLPPATVKITPK